MKKLIASIALAIVASLGLVACSTPSSNPVAVSAGTVVIDVRTPSEHAEGHLTGAINIDLQSPDFTSRIVQLPTDGKYLVYCASGNRSAQAAARMGALGFSNITDAGGISSASTSTGLKIVTTP
ncbi:MAG: rhodanese-like domain-containing protein [Lacisediminihabitans sp.]